MPMARREFLRSGLAVAAAAAATSGCSSLSLRESYPPSGGWDEVPEILKRIVPPGFPSRDFLITDYGAAGDERTDCRRAIADAIAACSKAGGGRVVVPAATGYYLVNGPIHLLSNVNLFLEEGSEIRFGTNPADYLPPVLVRYQGIRCYNYSPFIYAYQQKNIAVTGAGVINGQADHWAAWEGLANPDWELLQQMVDHGVPVAQRVFGSGHYLRIALFEPYQCENVLVQGVTFRASPFWTMHPVFCSYVSIQDVKVFEGTSNDDGCDPDSCSYVLIDGCTFSTADDNISLKAGYGSDAHGLPACEYIVIRNSNGLRTNWGAYTIGSNTSGIVRNVFIDNCSSDQCQNAFFIKSNRLNGGLVQNVFIRSSRAQTCQQFLCLQTDYLDVTSGPVPPVFANINLQDMSCERASGTAFAISGDDENPIQYVSLSNIAVGSAAVAQKVTNAVYVTSSNVTLDGRPITVSGLS